MELPRGEVLLAIAAVVLILVLVPRGRGFLRLVLLFGVTVAAALGVEWLVFIGIRTFYPQVTGTGLFEGLENWALAVAVAVAAFVTVIAWREGT